MKKLLIIISCTLTLLISTYLLIKHNIKSNLTITLNGEQNINLEIFTTYNDESAKAQYKHINLTNKIKIDNNLDTTNLGKYNITYKIKYKNIEKQITRTINIVDTQKPEIKLNGGDETYSIGQTYKEKNATAIDNYDGDITDKIEITNNIDNNKEGNYIITYKIKDSSGNENSITRNVTYKQKNPNQKVAVLNYHFFYDSRIGESCNEGICEDLKDFEEQLQYLKDNHFKTLTMEEFRAWMYDEIEIPEKSVLITIDDGAMGTGKHNGNKLIPTLEKYQMHATLFLITGWWDISNYQSTYLDIESHTNDMHKEGLCQGVTRGAQMLCSTYDEIINDLKQSINITQSNKAFCFPFYAYNDKTLKAIKDVGFQLGFVGGSKKATRTSDKYKIPRYQIMKTTTLETFKKYVN